jgi:hypothetical protein
MKADEAPGADPVPLEQDLSPPGVLAEHRVGFAQLVEDAERDVREIPIGVAQTARGI